MRILFASFLLLAACGGGTSATAQSDDGAVVETSVVLQGRLSKHDLETALKKAEAGDLNAMSKLEEHYAANGDKQQYVYCLISKFPNPLPLQCKENPRTWLQ